MVMPNACATPGWFVGSLVCGWWLVVVVFVGGDVQFGVACSRDYYHGICICDIHGII